MDKNMIIGVVNRPLGGDLSSFNALFTDVLQTIQTENKLCYIMGDYNVNLMNYESHDLTANFVDTIYSYYYVPLINRPTRVTQHSASLIDNIFTIIMHCLIPIKGFC